MTIDLDGQSLFSEGDVVLPISQDTCTGTTSVVIWLAGVCLYNVFKTKAKNMTVAHKWQGRAHGIEMLSWVVLIFGTELLSS